MKKLIRNFRIKKTLQVLAILLIGSAFIFWFAYVKIYKCSLICAAATVFVVVLPFAQMLYSFFHGDKYLDKYLKETHYTVDILDRELENSDKVGPVYIGYSHMFFHYFQSLRIVPVADIQKIEVRKARPNMRGSMRWVYKTYFEVEENIGYHLVFQTKKSAEQAVRLIKLRNPRVAAIHSY